MTHAGPRGHGPGDVLEGATRPRGRLTAILIAIGVVALVAVAIGVVSQRVAGGPTEEQAAPQPQPTLIAYGQVMIFDPAVGYEVGDCTGGGRYAALHSGAPVSLSLGDTVIGRAILVRSSQCTYTWVIAGIALAAGPYTFTVIEYGAIDIEATMLQKPLLMGADAARLLYLCAGDAFHC